MNFSTVETRDRSVSGQTDGRSAGKTPLLSNPESEPILFYSEFK